LADVANMAQFKVFKYLWRYFDHFRPENIPTAAPTPHLQAPQQGYTTKSCSKPYSDMG